MSARDARLPALVIGAGLLLALLALGLAFRSKSLLKDALDLDCSERAVLASGNVRRALDQRLEALRARRTLPAEASAAWFLDREGRVADRLPADAPDPDPRLLSGAPPRAPEPIVVRGTGIPLAAHWCPEERGSLLVLWDLAAVRARIVDPEVAVGGEAYALQLLQDTDTAEMARLPFRPKAVVALDPPLSFWRVAVGLSDPDAARLSLRLQTALLGALALCLLLALLGGVIASLRRERLEEARRRDREELLARAAHELQTPLALLRAAAESVERGAVTEPDEVRRCLEIVAREEERLTARVRRLLRHLRREVETGLEPGDPREEVEAAARELEPSLSAAGIRLELVDELGPGWRAPKELLGDAVRELLGNVARHARGATRARVWLGLSRGRAIVEVTDDGPGLPPALRPGLGLLLVGQGLSRAGGALVSAAAEGGGAKQRIEVPCQRA